MSEQPNIDQVVDGHRVKRSIYTDGGIFALEMERIFGRCWVFLCHESEVAEAGSFKTLLIGGQPVIVVRDDDGQIQVLMNTCMHRGASLCEEPAGRTRQFQCWYHGWTYNLKGELTGLSYPEGYGDRLDRSRFSLERAPRVESYRGLVFASLNPEVEGLVSYLAGAKRYLDVFMDLSPVGEIEAVGGAHKFTYPGNWKLQMENGVDGYHPNFTHLSFWQLNSEGALKVFSGHSPGETRDLGNGHAILDMSPFVRAASQSSAAAGLDTLPSDGLKPLPSAEYVERLMKRWGKERTEKILEDSNVNLIVFPNLLIVGVQLRTIVPISVNETQVTQQPTTLKGAPAEMNGERLRAHEVFYGPGGLGAPDDVEMFIRCARGYRVKTDRWIEFSRGLWRERQVDGERVGQITDEVPQRAFYRRWKKLMVQT